MNAPGTKSQTLIPEAAESLERLLRLRQSLRAEQDDAPTPAVAHALETADVYLFLAITYLGHTETVFPNEP